MRRFELILQHSLGARPFAAPRSSSKVNVGMLFLIRMRIRFGAMSDKVPHIWVIGPPVFGNGPCVIGKGLRVIL